MTLPELAGNNVSLLQDGQLDALALGQGHGGGGASANDEHVLLSGGESIASSVTHSGDVEGAGVVLDVGEGADAAGVTTLGDHDSVADLELEGLHDLASGQVNLDGVVDLDLGIGVADGAAVVGDDVGDSLVGQGLGTHTAQLESELLISDAVKGEATLGVVDQAELVVVGLALGLDLDGVHEASRVVGVGANLAVNVHVLLHTDDLGLLAGQSVLQAVAEDEVQGQALTQLVGALGRAGGLFINILLERNRDREGGH